MRTAWIAGATGLVGGCALPRLVKSCGRVVAFTRQLLLVSSVGADARSGNFYLRVKGELEGRLSGMPFESLHVFRPSFLIGERAERRMGGAIGIGAAKAVSFALAGPLRIYRAIEAETVGAAMVSAAGQHLPGKHVYHFDDMNLLRLRLEPTSRPR